MNREVWTTIRTYDMLQRSDWLVAGVSGGADSVALLHFLCGIRQEWDLRLVAAHLNHNLRGAESQRDEDFVRALCDQLDVDLQVQSSDVAELAAQRGLSVEQCAREERYGFFRQVAAEWGKQEQAADLPKTPADGKNTQQNVDGFVKIATAHTLSDSMETLLLNLARGTALRGLCGIPPVRGRIIRPLIGCTRLEIEAYCVQQELTYITDSSNLLDDYSRNKLRHHALPVLQELNPHLARTMANTMDALRADADYLDGLACDALRDIALDADSFDRAQFLGLPDVVAVRVLILLLSRRGLGYDRKRLALLRGFILAGSGGAQLSAGILFHSGQARFGFDAPLQPVPEFEITIDRQMLAKNAELLVFSDKKLWITTMEYEYYEKTINYQEKLLKNALDCDRIVGIIKSRLRYPSDKMEPAGRGCAKTLKKLFNEAKTPLSRRARTVVLADEAGPVWVEGFGVAQRAAPTAATRQVWLLKTDDQCI